MPRSDRDVGYGAACPRHDGFLAAAKSAVSVLTAGNSCRVGAAETAAWTPRSAPESGRVLECSLLDRT
jgi:hypothetical protein